jgi:hypothetical protein
MNILPFNIFSSRNRSGQSHDMIERKGCVITKFFNIMETKSYNDANK